MTITERKDYFEFAFPPRKILTDLVRYHFPAQLRRYDPTSKTYQIDKSLRVKVEQFADKHKFRFVDNAAQHKSWSEIPPLPSLDVNELDHIKRKLFPFQAEGVAFGLKEKKFMNGDDMGLGKTTQAIATATIANAFPVLVICPSSLKLNWQDEWETVAGRKSVVLNDSIRRTWPNFWKVMGIGVFIVNYESLRKYFVSKMPDKERYKVADIEFTELIKLFKTVIIDEAHRIKDWTTQQSKFCIGIASQAERVNLLSGTFVVNKPKDLVVPLTITGAIHSHFGGFKNFMTTYCPAGSGAENLAELNFKLRTSCFYMRFKKDVLTQLPDKTRQKVHCEISNRQEYDRAENNLRSYLFEEGKTHEQVTQAMRAELMVQIGVLKKISAKGKLKDALEYINDVVESGQKIVVFVHHREIANILHKELSGSVTVTGEDILEVRHANVHKFQNDVSCKVIICSISAAGVGLTLTSSSIVAFIEMGWSPKDQDQAEDRCHRIGQKGNVQCIYFIGKDTIDEHIYNIIDEKRKIVKAVTGGTHDVQTNILDDIIKLLKR